MSLKGMLVLFSLLFTLSSNMEVFILSKGFTGKPPLENAVIKSKGKLEDAWNGLEIKGEVPSIDFKEELVVILGSRGKLGSSVEVSKVEKKSNDVVEVRFAVKPPKADLKTKGTQTFPYVVLKLYPLGVEKVKVKFIEGIPPPPVPADSAIGQVPSYTSVLKEYGDTSIFQFFPLDRGNSWTYKIEFDSKSREETYSVLSISQDGWSIFDGFFGKENVALRVDPSGDVFVSSKDGVQTFYTQEVEKGFDKSEFLTPAGKFKDLMIVTVSENGEFWFKDVYAKGVGLIYHEHKSPKGTAKYTLIKAQVKGKNHP